MVGAFMKAFHAARTDYLFYSPHITNMLGLDSEMKEWQPRIAIRWEKEHEMHFVPDQQHMALQFKDNGGCNCWFYQLCGILFDKYNHI